MKKTALAIVLLITSVFIVNWRWFAPGLPLTHDSQMHVARIANYYLAVKDGHVPTRWAPNLNNGFGYPVFQFNYPLPYILALPLALFNLTFEQQYSTLAFLSIIVAVLSMYAFMRILFTHQLPAVLSALFYATSNYFITLLYVRGGLGEMWFAALLPLVLWTILKCSSSYSRVWISALVFSGSLLFLAHNVLLFFSLPLIAGFTLFIFFTRKRPFHLLWSISVGALLTSWFWFPAMLEKVHTPLQSVSVNTEFSKHFPTLSQLLWSPHDYGFSYLGPVDDVPMSIGIIILLLTWPALFFLFMRWSSRRNIALFFLGVVGLYSLFLLPLSYGLWLTIPWLSFVQFPWRLVIFIVFGLTVLVGNFIWRTKKHIFVWSIIYCLTVITANNRAVPQSHISHSDDYYLTTAETTSLHDENMPIHFNKHEAYAFASNHFSSLPVYIEDSLSSVEISRWSTGYHRYTVVTEQETRVFERTAYFPGWHVEINGKKAALIEDEKGLGMISFHIPPGEHTITTRFTEATPARTVGTIGTIIGLLLWFGLIVKKPRKSL